MVNIDIAIIEGNPHLRSLLGWHLQQAGYHVQQASSIQQGKHQFFQHQPHLVVLDSDLSDSDGMELCKWLYEQHKSLVLILSSRTQEKDVVTALKNGADDYLKKPFGMQEFMARVDALLRRIRVNSAPLYLDYGDLQIDLVQRRVQFQGNYIDLTPQEFSLLYVLAQAQGNPLSRSELLRRAWPDAIDNPRTIDTHVLSLRKKIETNPRKPSLIQTVRNIGYQFNQESLETEKVKPLNNNNVSGENSNNSNTHFKAQLLSS
jgi:two-component system OmpR family response regulator